VTAPLTVSRADTDHTTVTSLATVRRALLEELAAQQAQIDDQQATAEALAGQHDDDSTLQRQLAERGAARAHEVVTEIDAALRRIDDGTFGVCQRCTGAIANERLEAIPYARHCVACPAPERRLLG
jgi:DnaK suppressor protein